MLGMALVATGWSPWSWLRAPAEVSIPHGPFEIVAQGRRISAGGFPNNSGNPFATIEVTAFAIRHRGRPVSITHGTSTLTSFWRVVRLVDAPRPALLASTTDFHLVTEEDGRVVTRSFGEPSTNLAALQWLDADGGQPAAAGHFGIEAVDPSATELRGGRWLLLSHHTVLDVRTLRSFPVRPWVERGRGLAMEGLNGSGTRAVAFSPGETQYVTVGSGDYQPSDGESVRGLLVVDVPSGEAYGLPLDPRRTHFVEMDDVSPGWVAHYYRWTREPDGRERLVANLEATSLPRAGRLLQMEGGHVEYRVRPVRPEMLTAMARFIRERLDGRAAPDWIDPSKPSDTTFTVPGCVGVVAIGFYDDHVGVFAPHTSSGRATDCTAAVRRIAAAFDAELARGAYEDLFADD
jgi:hypothetical protein